MLSLTTAQKLKAAGLAWTPALHDFFMIPRPGLDERAFVISDLLTYVELVRGQPPVIFHGAVEWALDQIVVGEVVWLPREDQLREQLEQRLRAEAPPAVSLTSTADGYRCDVRVGGQLLSFEDFGASEAYARALLRLLEGGE